MNIYGVIGHPIAYSLSPAIHNAAFKELKIDAIYKTFDISPQNLSDFMRKARSEIAGLSVTIPYKVEIMKYLDKIDEKAKKIGAVNTIINENGILKGLNTDVDGAMQALEEVTKISNKNILVLGAGGAARAIVYGLKEKNTQVTILNRTLEKAQQLAEEFNCNFDRLENLKKYTPEILINATSLGMLSNIDESLVPKDFFRPRMVVFDIVYKPLMTKLLQDAKKAGCQIITGEKMLLYQAVKQFEIWTNQKAPVKVMQEALMQELLLTSSP